MCVCTRLVTLVVAGAALALAAGNEPAMPALRCPTGITKEYCEALNSTETFKDFRVKLPYSKQNTYSRGFLTFSYEGGNILRVKCIFNLDLDSSREYLPQFRPALHVGIVMVVGCPPAHYIAVLATLNITLTSPFRLELYSMQGKLTDAHLEDLHHVRHLKLTLGNLVGGLPPSLEVLTMEYMHLLDDTLEALPRTLTELRLERVNITRVPAAVLDLPKLRSLHVVNEKDRTVVTVERSNTSRLQRLYMAGADAALFVEWAPPALEEVTLQDWQGYRLTEKGNSLPGCDKLVKFTLLDTQVYEFPAGWVARCPRLEELHITGTHVSELPERLLVNATHLTSFSFQDSPRLSSLPAQLFADTPHLTHLYLRANTLSELPAQLFVNIPHLTHLDISSNRLTQLPSSMLTLPLVSLHLGQNEFQASVVAEVASRFPELRNLSLERSLKISDLCTVNDDNVPGKSPLATLSKLERLELQVSGISLICRDWREAMVNLKYLDLSNTNLGNLTYENLQYRRNVPAVVKLAGTVYFTADDYNRAAAAAAMAPPTRTVTLILESEHLDCNKYWLAKAVNDGLLPVDDVVIGASKLSLKSHENLLCTKKKM